MNVDPLSIALSQISYLVKNLSKKNFKTSCKELTELISLRSESDRHFLRCLLSEVDLNSDVPRSANSKDAQQLQLLAHEFSILVRKPAFVSALCYAVDQIILEDSKIKNPSQVIPTLCKLLKLTPVQEIIIGLSLINSSVIEVSNSAEELLKLKLPTVISNHISEDKKRVEGDLHDSSPEILHLILTYLLSGEEASGISAVEKELFLNSIGKDFPIELVPIILAPILYPSTDTDFPIEKLLQTSPDLSKAMKEEALPELIKEIGYGFCSSMEEGRRYLNMLDFEMVSAATIARILIMMIRTNTGLETAAGSSFWHDGNAETPKEKEGGVGGVVSIPTSWNVEVFVQLLKEMKGNVVWSDVIGELDNGELFIKDRQSLGILMKALKLGFASQGYHPSDFPVDLLLRQWKYPECQFLLISQILKNPDIFCFSDYPIRSVSMENLKTTPESESKELSTWRSIDLMDLLMSFAESGMQKQVHELLKFPVQHTADVLILALVQSNQAMTIFKRDLINSIMPIFLANHPNSGAVVHIAWQTQNIVVRQILMHSMSEWYLRGDCDQSRLSRILDLIHDLKALSTLLNMSTYPFVIDLACLASRREYLKLEKWLTDKIRDQGESFVNSLIDFVKRRFLVALPKTEYSPKYAHLPQETVAIILASLQISVGSFSPEVTENVMNLIANCNLVINKGRPIPQSVLRANRNIDPLSFQQHNQLFSSQNTEQQMPSCITSGLSNLSLAQPSNGFNISRDVMIPLPPELQCQVSKDVEEEANTYFQKIYNQPPNLALSPDYIIELLKNFKDSPDKRERDLFMCMVRNLFEEYKFFPQYPDKELRTTAQLFGGVLQMNLLTETPLFGIGLRLILDSLKKYGNPKMFIFGVTALEQIKTRLKEMPKICELFMNLSNFSEFPRTLAEYVEYGFQGLDPPQRNPVPTTSLSSNLSPFKAATNVIGSNNSSPGAKLPSSRPSLLNSTNIDTLLGATEKDEKIVMPPEPVQDKVAFIFNNLSQLNLSLKCDEMRGLIREEYLHWLSQYLVMKRASIEQNFHVLYSNFIDCIQLATLLKLVIKETYRNIKVLLDSDKCMSNFSDRTLLKNLGHWLGIITLGKNKPILASDIDIPMLLVEAYQKGLHELMYIVPFVAKVLESCARSKIFQPGNPWTMWTLGLLTEIHQDNELKLNLKFEIEVLCKNLQVDLKDVMVLNMLKEGHLVTHMTYQLSNGGNKNHHSSSSSSSSPLPCNMISHAPPPHTPPAHSAPSSVVLPSSSIASSPSTVTASSSSGEEIPFIPQSNSSAMPGSSTTPPMPEPRFNFLTFNVTGVNSLSALLTINGQLPLFQSHPHLKAVVRPAFERAVQDWMAPIVDRSVKIAVNTSEHIVKKDFALDPDESRVRAAAHYIVRNLAAGMAMITCREQIVNSFTINLKNNFLGIIMNANSIQKELIEQTITATVNDNMDLACAFVQKSAVEKAIVDIDRHLFTEYERRRNARNEGRRYCDSGILTYQAERVPEQVRLKVGDVSSQQMIVYEEFAKNIPGFQPLSDKEAALFAPKPTIPLPFGSSNDEVGQIFEKLASELEVYFQSTSLGPVGNTTNIPHVHAIIDFLLTLRRSRDSNTATMLVSKVVEGIIDGLSQMASNPDVFSKYQEFYLRILKCLQDPRAFGIPWTNKQVTRSVIESREDQRFNLEAVDFLIRTHFINLPIYDACIAQSMDNGANYVAVAFAMQLVQHYLVQTQDRSHVTDQDFRNIMETLIRVGGQPRIAPDGLIALLDVLKMHATEASGNLTERSQTGVAAYIHSGILQARNNEEEDSPVLIQKTNYLLQEWSQIYQGAAGKDPGKSFTLFVQQMNMHGILKTDDLITKFFRIATHMVVNTSYKEYADPNYVSGNARTKIFFTVDSFVKLIALLVRHSGDANNTTTKLNLLNKVLGIVAGVMLEDQEKFGKNFIPIAYYRLFSMLYLELNVPDPVLDAISINVLQAFTHVYHILRPTKAPGFTYSWLSLISHRLFIGKALVGSIQKGWSLYAHLLIDLFKYLAPFLRNTELSKPVTMLYKGTLRVLLVMLHDFPEFLCDYHYGLCDVIPPNCIQLRNLILSAFPRTMRLPDPFTPNLKVDMLPEIIQHPRIATNYIASLTPESFKKNLDSYLKERAPVTFLSELRTSLQVCSEPGSKYNISLVNALVLYVGTQAITFIRSKGTAPSMSNITHSAHMDIFQNLSVDLDTEGRYLFLNAIANQLRYPNSHTHYFSCALLYLFGEANAEVIQEQITRILLERIIVNRPHPWGLLITFIELIKNPTYKFWEHEFVTCAPEIEKLFESVARSCMVQRQLVTAAVEHETTHPDLPVNATLE